MSPFRGGRRGIPPHFELVQREDGFLAVVRSDHRELLARASLLDPERLLGESAPASGGRGRIARLLVRPAGALVLKKYRRGGLLARWLPDRFVGPGRMLADLAAGERARAHAIPGAAAIALILDRRAPGLWSGYLLSEEIPEARTLGDALAAAPAESAVVLARRAVGIVRRLHDAGILHRDLNLGNLLEREGEIFVIDFDGAQIKSALSAAERFGNLSRLDRSFAKRFGNEGPLAPADRAGLLETYAEGDAALLEDLRSRLPAHARALERHGWLWRKRAPAVRRQP